MRRMPRVDRGRVLDLERGVDAVAVQPHHVDASDRVGGRIVELPRQHGRHAGQLPERSSVEPARTALVAGVDPRRKAKEASVVRARAAWPAARCGR